MKGLVLRVLARLQSPLCFVKLRWDLEGRNAATDRDRKKELMYGRLLIVCTHKHVSQYMWVFSPCV